MRLGVISTSRTSSVRTPKYSAAGIPIRTLSRGNRIIPLLSWPTPISTSLHSIPKLSTPRILPFLIVNVSSPCPSTVPIVATTTAWPTPTLGAPQTIWRGSSAPISTVVTCRWSLFSWSTQVSTWPITKPLSPPGTDSTSSTPPVSRPIEVRALDSSSAVRFVCTYSRSQS